GSGQLELPGGKKKNMFDIFMEAESASIRAWTARAIGEDSNASSANLEALNKLAKDNDPSVRAAVATAVRQFTSGSLTVDAQPATTVSTSDLLAPFKELLSRPSVEGDFYYPHIVWMAMEPRVAQDPQPFYLLLAAND